MGNAHGRTPSGLNLIKEAKNFYDLIQEFNFTPQLFQKTVAEEALRRYEFCWLPLVADYPEVRLLAPLDIELIWTVHMHNPTAYLADCKQFYGSLIDHVIASYEERQQDKTTEYLWIRKYPNEPFTYTFTPEKIPFQSSLSSNIIRALNDFRIFCRQVALPHFKDEKFLSTAIDEYLYNAQFDDFLKIAYPYDRAFIWKSHMLNPHAFQNDITFLGKFIDYTKLTFLKESPGVTQGAMFRGDVSPLLLNGTDDIFKGERIFVLGITGFRLENLKDHKFYELSLKKKSHDDDEETLTQLNFQSKGNILIKTFKNIRRVNTIQFNTLNSHFLKIQIAQMVNYNLVDKPRIRQTKRIYCQDLFFPENKDIKQSDRFVISFHLKEVINGRSERSNGQKEANISLNETKEDLNETSINHIKSSKDLNNPNKYQNETRNSFRENNNSVSETSNLLMSPIKDEITSELRESANVLSKTERKEKKNSLNETNNNQRDETNYTLKYHSDDQRKSNSNLNKIGNIIESSGNPIEGLSFPSNTSSNQNETNSKLNENCGSMNKTNSNLNETSIGLNETSNSLNKTIIDLNKNYSNLNETNNDLIETSDGINKASNNQDDTSSDLNETSNDHTKTKNDHNIASNNLNDTSNSLNGISNSLNKTIIDLNENCGNLNETNKDLIETGGANNRSSNDLSEPSNNLNETSNDLNETANNLNEASNGLHFISNSLNKTIIDLNENCGNLNDTNNGLIETIGGINKTSNDLNETNNVLNDTTNDMNGISNNFNKIINDLNDLNERNNYSIETSDGDLNKASDGRNESSSDLNETNNSLHEISNGVNIASKNLNETSNNLNKYSNSLNETSINRVNFSYNQNETCNNCREFRGNQKETNYDLEESNDSENETRNDKRKPSNDENNVDNELRVSNNNTNEASDLLRENVISGRIKFRCFEVIIEPATFFLVKESGIFCHKHYGEVLQQPFVFAPHIMELNEAPCKYLDIAVVTSLERKTVLNCRWIFSDLSDFSSVELLDLRGNIFASSNTIGKESLPSLTQVAHFRRCCVLMNAPEKTYIVRGTNWDSGLLKVTKNDSGLVIVIQFMNLRKLNRVWELLFDYRDKSHIIYCKSLSVTVNISTISISLNQPQIDVSSSFSLGLLLLSVFCKSIFMPDEC